MSNKDNDWANGRNPSPEPPDATDPTPDPERRRNPTPVDGNPNWSPEAEAIIVCAQSTRAFADSLEELGRGYDRTPPAHQRRTLEVVELHGGSAGDKLHELRRTLAEIRKGLPR